MAVGNILPSTQGLIAHDLTPGYCITGVKKRIVVVPSLDTPVCEWQVKALSSSLEAGKSGREQEVYVLSMDTLLKPASLGSIIHIQVWFSFQITPNVVFWNSQGLRLMNLVFLQGPLLSVMN